VRLFIVKAIRATELADSIDTLLLFHLGSAHAYHAPQKRLKGFRMRKKQALSLSLRILSELLGNLGEKVVVGG
jgi:hypothetical protein